MMRPPAQSRKQKKAPAADTRRFSVDVDDSASCFHSSRWKKRTSTTTLQELQTNPTTWHRHRVAVFIISIRAPCGGSQLNGGDVGRTAATLDVGRGVFELAIDEPG